jgi:V/A-type H+-transporting ATPase subunit D
VSGRAVRSALHALRRDLEAARLGRDLLDDKREAILRTLLERAPRHKAAGAAAVAALAAARRRLVAAVVECGRNAVDAAVLAQPAAAAVDWRPGSVVGVPTPALTARIPAFTPRYGAASLTAELDRAGEDFSAAAGALVAFAEEDAAARNLQTGLSRTIRRLRALEQIVIPEIERQRRAVAVAVEEDERDDTVRYRQAGALRRTSWPNAPSETP